MGRKGDPGQQNSCSKAINWDSIQGTTMHNAWNSSAAYLTALIQLSGTNPLLSIADRAEIGKTQSEAVVRNVEDFLIATRTCLLPEFDTAIGQPPQSIEQRRPEPTVGWEDCIVFIVEPTQHRYDNIRDCKPQQRCAEWSRPFKSENSRKSAARAEKYRSRVIKQPQPNKCHKIGIKRQKSWRQ